MLGGGQLAFGALMLMDAAPTVWDDIQAMSNSTNQTNQAWLRLGEHSSYALAGGVMAPSGIALMVSQHVSEGWQSRLYSMGKTGGIFSVAALGLGEGFQISRYRSGDISSREFWTSQYVLSTTGAGTASGMWLGRLAALTPCGLLCGQAVSVLGSIAGGWIGGQIGQRFADDYCDQQFVKLDQKFGEYVYERYGVR